MLNLETSAMQRAFVVQLKAECVPGENLAGRVEHVRSGEGIHFETTRQLIEFFARAIHKEKQTDALEREEALQDPHCL